VTGTHIIVLSLLLLYGCAGAPEGEPSAVVVEAPDYWDILKQWTRSEEVYERFETRLYVNATYKSLPFRKAYIDEYAEKYRIDEDLKRVHLEREVDSFETSNEFFLSAFTPVDSWNDFDKKGSIWKLYLEDDLGRRVEPVEIERADSQDPLLKAFFPYLNYWSSGYIVKFPRYDDRGELIGGSDARYLRLIVTGIMGHSALEWSLEK
jgi:hypothetical protein